MPSLKVLGLDLLSESSGISKTLIIGISVGDEKQEGSYFSALMETINKLAKEANVQTCLIAVCDSLQRHNYMIDGTTTEETALTKSILVGNQWVEKNMQSLTQLQIIFKVIRWEEWRNNKKFKLAISDIKKLYEEDSFFKEAVEKSIRSFTSRFKTRYKKLENNSDIDEDALYQCCRNYLLEECAIIMNFWPMQEDQNQKFILYPGKMTAALECAYEKLITQKNFFSWQKYRFKKVDSIPLLNSIPPNPVINHQTSSIIKNFIENCKQDDKRMFLVSLAACTSIVEGNRPVSETLFLLENYTKFLLMKSPSIEPSSVNNNMLFTEPRAINPTDPGTSSKSIIHKTNRH